MDDERPREPHVERVERPDGRYVLYFSWSDDAPGDQPPAEDPVAADE